MRRSAGIPPTIIAILRAEPAIIKANRSYNQKRGVTDFKTEDTLLLNKTLSFLLSQIQNPQGREDTKIHSLNIMKFVFSDSFLRADASQFVAKAMMLSMEEFKSENWNIRNSALMCFTALIRRLLNTYHI